MAAGGGEFLPAVFATVIILVALNLLGWVERRFGLKSSLMGYSVVSGSPESAIKEINRVLDAHKLTMKSIQLGGTAGNHRIHFTVDAKHSEHNNIAEDLRKCADLQRVELLHESETD
jgi:putative Mg2+ transporter-C (MgtC) family protein